MKSKESKISAFIESLPADGNLDKIQATLLTTNMSLIGGTTDNKGNCTNTSYVGCDKSKNGGACMNAESACDHSTNYGSCNNSYNIRIPGGTVTNSATSC